MKIQVTILLGLLCISSTTSCWWWQKKSGTNDKNNNVNNISIHTTVNSSASAQIIDTAVSAAKEAVEKIKEEFEASFQLLVELSKSLIKQNKWKVVLGGSVTGYSAIVINNQRTKSYLIKPDRWHFWAATYLNSKKLTSVEESAWQLIREIQSRYTNQKNPDDFVSPFIRFIKEINNEIKTIKHYIRLGRIFEYLHLSRYLFFDTNVYNQCAEWLEQAETIKTIFLSWIAEYKLQQHTRLLQIYRMKSIKNH